MPSSCDPRAGKAIADAAAAVIPGGVNSSTRYIGAPYAFVAADGAYLTDADGRRYLDYHAAFGAILLGHNAPVVNDAIRGALERRRPDRHRRHRGRGAPGASGSSRSSRRPSR